MNIKNYTIGFVLSLLLTCAAFTLVELHLTSNHGWPSHTFIIPAVLVFALVQFAVQIMFFLHISTAPASRERLIALGFTLVIVFILVAGSLWIMANLDQRMVPSDAHMTQYMDSQPGL